MMTFEVRHWYSNHEAGIDGERPGNTIGNTLLRREGLPGRSTATTSTTASWAKKQEPGPERTGAATTSRTSSQAVRSRKRADLNAEIEEGAISCVADAPGQHLLPRGPHAELGREDLRWSRTTRKPTRCSRGNTASPTWCRRRCRGTPAARSRTFVGIPAL